jgi:hypothetical protein
MAAQSFVEGDLRVYNFYDGCLQIKTKGYHAGRDEEFDSFIFDEAAEDKVTI